VPDLRDQIVAAEVRFGLRGIECIGPAAIGSRQEAGERNERNRRASRRKVAVIAENIALDRAAMVCAARDAGIAAKAMARQI
jgi:hypothetical protein